MTGGHRRVSCKDLGGGDCQGWLLMKKTDVGGFSLLRSKWNKFWFVLTKKTLFYYKQPDVRCRLHVPTSLSTRLVRVVICVR